MEVAYLVPLNMTNKRVAKLLTGFYDAFGVIISISDISTDILLAYDYYTTGKTFFFWTAMTILFITQVSYTLIFLLNYFPNPTTKQKLTVWFCVFPIAQFVPIFIWLDSLHISLIRRIYHYFGLHPLNEAPKRIDFETKEFDKHLYSWIRSKAAAHFGFIVEACLEAFPQSILALVCVVYYQELSPLAMYSILISLTTIVSKGVVISYSIDPVVFAFNFCCVSLDILGFFVTLMWVLYQPPEAGGDSYVTWMFWLQLKAMIMFAAFSIVLILVGVFLGPRVHEGYDFVLGLADANLTWSSFLSQLYSRGFVPLISSLTRAIFDYYTKTHFGELFAFHFFAGVGVSILVVVPAVVISILQIFNLMILEILFVVEEFRNARKTGFSLAMTYILAGETGEERGLRFAALLAASQPELREKQLQEMLHNCSTKTIRTKFWEDILWGSNKSRWSFWTWFSKLNWNDLPMLQLAQFSLVVYVFVFIPLSFSVSLVTNIFLPIIGLLMNYDTADDLQIVLSSAYAFLCFLAICLLPHTCYFRYWQFHVGRRIKGSVKLDEVEQIRTTMTRILKVRKLLNIHLKTDIAGLVAEYLPQSLNDHWYPPTKSCVFF